MCIFSHNIFIRDIYIELRTMQRAKCQTVEDEELFIFPIDSVVRSSSTTQQGPAEWSGALGESAYLKSVKKRLAQFRRSSFNLNFLNRLIFSRYLSFNFRIIKILVELSDWFWLMKMLQSFDYWKVRHLIFFSWIAWNKLFEISCTASIPVQINFMVDWESMSFHFILYD